MLLLLDDARLRQDEFLYQQRAWRREVVHTSRNGISPATSGL